MLYQHDAACRVIARLMRERDEARAMVSQRQGQMAEAAAAQAAGGPADQMDVDGSGAAEITEAVISELNTLGGWGVADAVVVLGVTMNIRKSPATSGTA